jgi:hypothetical protein
VLTLREHRRLRGGRNLRELIPANTSPVRDEGRDTDAFRSFLKEHGVRTIIPGNQTANSAFGVITKETMASGAASAASGIGDALPRVMTNWRTIFCLRRASSPCPPIGFELVESAS